MSGKDSNLKIPDWRDVDPKLQDRVIAELDEWKWRLRPLIESLHLRLLQLQQRYMPSLREKNEQRPVAAS